MDSKELKKLSSNGGGVLNVDRHVIKGLGPNIKDSPTLLSRKAELPIKATEICGFR